MDLSELICHNKTDYINMAIKLGVDIEYRKTIEQIINTKKKILFNDKESIIEWGNLLDKV